MEDAIDLAPGALVLMVGANDLAQKASGVVFLGNVRLIIEAPKKHNATMPTVLSETSPCAPDEYRPVTIPCPAS